MPGSTVPLGFPYPLAGDPISASDVQALAEAVDTAVADTFEDANAARSPAAFRISAGTQPVLNNTATSVVFDTVHFDNRNAVDLTGSPVTQFVPEDGDYDVFASVVFAANTSGWRSLTLVHNGSGAVRERQPASPTATFPTTLQIATLRNFLTTGTIVLQVQHNAGVTLNITSAKLTLTRVG